MTGGFTTPEGECYRAEIEAEKILARLDLFEDLAELAETETVEAMRERLRTRYRQLAGIELERRVALHAALRRVMDGTDAWAEIDALLHGTA